MKILQLQFIREENGNSNFFCYIISFCISLWPWWAKGKKCCLQGLPYSFCSHGLQKEQEHCKYNLVLPCLSVTESFQKYLELWRQNLHYVQWQNRLLCWKCFLSLEILHLGCVELKAEIEPVYVAGVDTPLLPSPVTPAEIFIQVSRFY